MQEAEKRQELSNSQLQQNFWKFVTLNVNVETLEKPRKTELLRSEMEPYECDIQGLTAMRLTGVAELNGGEFIWSGEEKNHKSWVEFLRSNRAKGALLGYIPVNSRFIAARFSGAPLDIAVIQVYASTSDSSEEDIETFHEQLEHSIKELPKKDVRIIIGDWQD